MNSKNNQWVDFAQGRARFSNGIRGFDEVGHETFAIEFDGTEYFGELKKSWLPDRCNYDIDVVSFGFSEELQIGMPIDSWSVRAFKSEQLESIKLLIVELINFGISLEERPFILRESTKAKFTGKISFTDDWALVQVNESKGIG